jgi:peptide/nickel transport system ATP-binding protein
MTLLAWHQLEIKLEVRGNSPRTLVHPSSWSIQKGEFLAFVGRSGSGKSLSAMACLGFAPEPGGRIYGQMSWLEKPWTPKKASDWQTLRGSEIACIFQEPSQTLHPLYTIGQQLREAWKLHRPHKSDRKTGEDRMRFLFERVGLRDPERIFQSLPHQLSGGMMQRVCIAMALLHSPKLLIADEPTTALDVTVQKQIMELIVALQNELGMAVLFITHNLALVAERAHRVLVLSEGQIVDAGTPQALLQNPGHPETQLLWEAAPRLDLPWL